MEEGRRYRVAITSFGNLCNDAPKNQIAGPAVRPLGAPFCFDKTINPAHVATEWFNLSIWGGDGARRDMVIQGVPDKGQKGDIPVRYFPQIGGTITPWEILKLHRQHQLLGRGNLKHMHTKIRRNVDMLHRRILRLRHPAQRIMEADAY